MCGIWGLLNNNKILTWYASWFKSFNKISHRGPDNTTAFKMECGVMGFHRLSINDTSSLGNQPFAFYDEERNSMFFGCINGEIYNYAALASQYDIKCNSECDCEIVMHLFIRLGGKKMVKLIIGEFAIAILEVPVNNERNQSLFLARDHMGIRPLFYSFSNDMKWFNFSSELKGIIGIKDSTNNEQMNGFTMGQAYQFKPGHYATINLHKSSINTKIGGEGGGVHEYKWKMSNKEYSSSMKVKASLKCENVAFLKRSIRKCLKRCVSDMILHSPDVQIGALLSGGLDSSLIVSILAKRIHKLGGNRLRTFSVGMPGSTDKEYAQMVADHCVTEHTHIELSRTDMLDLIPNVIKAIESYDVTTVRASIGQYAIGQWISKNTPIKVLFIGDGSDELTSGYMYFKNNQNPTLMHEENIRLLQNISSFDVLRCDRGLAAHGLEARVPFLHKDFVSLYLNINPVYRMPFQRTRSNSIEKHLLRSSFDIKDDKTKLQKYLPEAVLWRKKEAFSDGITSEKDSWHTFIKDHVLQYHQSNIFNMVIYPQGFENAIHTPGDHIDEHTFGPKKKYNTNAIELLSPNNSLNYEKVFYYAIFTYYYGPDEKRKIIPYQWMPQFCSDAIDPSARTLKAYR